jgi:toxin YoeB
MNFTLVLTDEASEDFDYHVQSGDKGRIKKIGKLLAELEVHPERGAGRPEMLKHQFSGCWSRRITEEHRIVYRIDNEAEEVVIYAMRNHYK